MQQGLSGPDGFGARHLTPDKHIRVKNLGYKNALDLIEDVAKRHDVVVEQRNGRLMLVKRDGRNFYAIAEQRNGGLERFIGKSNPYYGVTTGFPEAKKNVGKNTEYIERIFRRGGKKLWEQGP